MPGNAYYSSLLGSSYDWSYKTVPQPNANNRVIGWPRGKVLGGSSCLNYYTWIPGSAATFDDWTEYGGDEWSWDKVKDYLYKVRSWDSTDKKTHTHTHIR